MTGLVPQEGCYVDRYRTRWFPGAPDGGPVISEHGVSAQLAVVIREFGPVQGLFQAAQEGPR